MKILLPDMHSTIPKSFGMAFKSFGATMLLPGHSFADKIAYGRKWNQIEINNELKLDNVKSIEYDELILNPPDVIMITCFEVEHDVLSNIWNKIDRSKTKLVYYSGNDNTGMYYNQQYCINIICADINSYAFSRVNDKHVVRYFPWIDYDTFKYAGTSDIKIFGTYIGSYQKLFPGGYNIASIVMKSIEDKVKWIPIDGVPKYETYDYMKNSMATLHCKDLEGYGYAIIESLAVGRPLIIYRPFSENRSYTEWCIDNKNSIYFNSPDEFSIKINKFIEDEEYRYNMQKSASEIVKKVIDNNEQNELLKGFFEYLR